MKTKKPHWILRYFGLCLLFTVCYCFYLYAFMGVRITLVAQVQDEYAKYLVEMQDEFVGHTLEFMAMVEDTGREYTEAEKDNITDELVAQNEVLKNLQKNPPNDENDDYADIYNDILKIMAFYIQGETMQAEYVYGYKTSYLPDEELSSGTVRQETYTMGIALCNIMGNMMLNNYRYINQVRDTNYESMFEIIEVGNLENYFSDITSDDIAEEVEDLLNGRTERVIN